MMKRFLTALLVALVSLTAAPSWSQVVTGTTAAANLDTRHYTPTTSLRQVTNRTHISGHATNGITSGMSRVWQTSFVPIRFIQVDIPNWYVDQTTGLETGSGGTATVGVSVEYPVGTCTVIPYGGAATGSIASGADGLTDLKDLGFTIPAFAKFYIRVYVANATAVIVHDWSKAADVGRGDAFVFNGSNLTSTCGTVTDNANAVYTIFPSLVLSYSNLKVWASFGDSTGQGVSDTVADPSGGTGWFGRALSAFGPNLNMATGGDRLMWFNASHTKRVALATLGGMTNGINGYGINDYSAGQTSAQMATGRASFRGTFAPLPIWDITVPPRSTSTDLFKTSANQTINNASTNGQRVPGNNAVRAGEAGAAGYIEISGLVETSTAFETAPIKDGGVWLSKFAANGDGTHPITAGYEATTSTIQRMLEVQIQ